MPVTTSGNDRSEPYISRVSNANLLAVAVRRAFDAIGDTREGYLQTLNKREAARLAGYTESSATRHAHEVFRRPRVREAIETLMRQRIGATKTWLIDKLVAIIDTNLADIASWGEDGDLTFKASSELTDEQKVAVAEVINERTKLGDTLKVKLYDKIGAITHLAKLMHILVDRQEISGPDGGPLEVTDYRAKIADRLNAMAKRTEKPEDGAQGSA